MEMDVPLTGRRQGRRSIEMTATLGACAAMLTGCARATMMTTVHPDGSWVRKLSFHAPATKQNNLQTEVKLAEVFVLPNGAPWKTTQTQNESDVVYTAERIVKPGETAAQDLQLKAKGALEKKGGPLRDEVSVRTVGPGRWEYRETLHWQGEVPKDLASADPEAVALIRSALPPALATEANVREVSRIVSRAFWRMLFGPGDPLISQLFGQLMMNPDLAERRMKQRVGSVIRKGLDEKFAAQMSPEERLQVTRKLVDGIAKSTAAKVKAKSQPGPDAPADKDSSPAMVALTYSVKLPGKIIETNGEIDELTGEVFWALYPEAAAAGDIALIAVCEVGR